MSQQLISLNPDLKRLRDEGYEIEVKSGYLLTHSIPYLNANRELMKGTLITSLTMSGNRTIRPDYHVIHFIGDHPCDKQGSILMAIQHVSQYQQLTPDLSVNHSFSNKPVDGYQDFYHKVTRYAEIISAPAKSMYPGVTEKTFRVIAMTDGDSVFKYMDTNSSRANINTLNGKFEGQKIAIVGLGGTGAYILDLVAKTPVQEIHLFDGDWFQSHNAFRSPGAASLQQLNEQPTKVDYLARIYANMRNGIITHPYNVENEVLAELSAMDYVFVCVDDNEARRSITNYLANQKISFSDVGLGVTGDDEGLVGLIRVTSSTGGKTDHLPKRLPCDTDGNNEYKTNIQIAELNALNAVLAVLRWKKIHGFYKDTVGENHSVYSLSMSELMHEDHENAA